MGHHFHDGRGGDGGGLEKGGVVFPGGGFAEGCEGGVVEGVAGVGIIRGPSCSVASGSGGCHGLDIDCAF